METFADSNPDDAYVKRKHLSFTGGNGVKFLEGAKEGAEKLLKEVITKRKILGIADNGLTPKEMQSYQYLLDAGKEVETKGEHFIKIILSIDGGMLSAYPANNL